MDLTAAKLALLLALAAEDPSLGNEEPYERMVGNVGYTIMNDKGLVELRCDKIEHNVSNTGTMRLVLWACTSISLDGKSWQGYRVAEAKLDNLESGYSYGNIKQTVPLNRPPDGRYVAVMSLESLQNGVYKTEDSRRFDNPLVIGGSAPRIIFLI